MKTKSSLLTVFFAVICVAFSLQSCTNAKPLESSDLEGYWVLKSMNGKEAKSLFAGALPTLKLDFSNMQISGTGGCNRYTGAFTFENNVLKAPNLASTRMLCFDENSEPEFLMELAKDNTLSIVNGVLTFTNRDKEVTLEFEKGEEIDETPVTVTAEMLQGTWTLIRLEGAEANVVFSGENPRMPTLIVDATENRISGNAGCNSYSAPFSLDGNNFIAMAPVATMMACPNLDGETKYLKNLQDTLMVSLPNPDVLFLMKNDQAVLEFVKNKE